MRVTEEAFASDDGEYIKIPPLPNDEPQGIGVECGECGVKFNYERLYSRLCFQGRCPLRSRYPSAMGLLFTP